MSISDVLDEDEIDALLSTDEEDNETFEADVVEEYDFATSGRRIKGRYPTLEVINDQFCQKFSAVLYEFLKGDASITTQELKMMKYEEYFNSLFVPSSINLVSIAPLEGVGSVNIDAKLSFLLVDSFFGGTGRIMNRGDSKELTGTEQRIIDVILQRVFACLESAWKPFKPLKFKKEFSEMNASLINHVDRSINVVVTTFRIDIEGGGGDLQVVMPYTMLESMRNVLMSEEVSADQESNPEWKQAVKNELMQSKIEVSVDLCRTKSTLREVLGFEEGDVIPIDMPDALILKANEIPTHVCSYGTSNGHLALKVLDKCKRD